MRISDWSSDVCSSDLAALIQSNEVAFRVHFEGPAPPPAERYWRGPVFDNFDGRTWKRGWTQARPLQSDAVRYEGTPVRYELTLEATRMPWLMALDLPQPVDRKSTRLNSSH